MAYDDLAQRVINIVTETIGADSSDVTPAVALERDLDADDLDLVEIVMALEEEFDILISDEELSGTLMGTAAPLPDGVIRLTSRFMEFDTPLRSLSIDSTVGDLIEVVRRLSAPA